MIDNNFFICQTQNYNNYEREKLLVTSFSSLGEILKSSKSFFNKNYKIAFLKRDFCLTFVDSD